MNALEHGTVLQGANHQYIIERVQGQGAFGITYLAKFKHQIQGELASGSTWMQVCIKEFFMKDFNQRDASSGMLNDTSGVTLLQKYRKAFFREAVNLAHMNHDSIVKVFEVFEANNTVYIVMEYIDGCSLDAYITARGCIPEQEALGYFRQICNATLYMHEHKMLHLDIKPKNVMIDETGHCYLIDFGLSKQYDEEGNPESSTTIGLGTPGYAPSEQVDVQDSDKSFRATIDVYALGATLYKMLTGQTPPKATEVVAAMLDGGNLILSNLTHAGISHPLAEKVSQAMWPSSTKRVQDVSALIQMMCPPTVVPEAPKVTDADETTIVEQQPVADDATVVGGQQNMTSIFAGLAQAAKVKQEQDHTIDANSTILGSKINWLNNRYLIPALTVGWLILMLSYLLAVRQPYTDTPKPPLFVDNFFSSQSLWSGVMHFFTTLACYGSLGATVFFSVAKKFQPVICSVLIMAFLFSILYPTVTYDDLFFKKVEDFEKCIFNYMMYNGVVNTLLLVGTILMARGAKNGWSKYASILLSLMLGGSILTKFTILFNANTDYYQFLNNHVSNLSILLCLAMLTVSTCKERKSSKQVTTSES